MNYNQQRVGRNIRFLRKRLRMNINQLAKAVSITPSFLGLVERGERGLRIENLCKLSSVFGISLDDLVYMDFSQEEKKDVARETAAGDFFKQINAYMRGASEEEIGLILKIIREIRAYTKNTLSGNMNGNGVETEY